MFICERCGKTEYENFAISTESVYNRYGEYSHTEEIVLQCDRCGGQLVPARLCPICGTEYIPDDEDLCDKCFENACTFENCEDMGAEATEHIDLNGFLFSVFSESEIEEILRKEFKSMPLSQQQYYIQRYCAEDTYYLESWLEEKNKK